MRKSPFQSLPNICLTLSGTSVLVSPTVRTNLVGRKYIVPHPSFFNPALDFNQYFAIFNLHIVHHEVFGQLECTAYLRH